MLHLVTYERWFPISNITTVVHVVRVRIHLPPRNKHPMYGCNVLACYLQEVSVQNREAQISSLAKRNKIYF